MAEARSLGALPDPAVDPRVYDAEYYVGCCAGHEEWTASDGQKMAGIYRWALGQVDLAPGETLLDIGTGRAELVAHAAEQGAKLALGIEYSADALPIAQKTIAARGVSRNAHVMLADARRLPLPDRSLDAVTMLDVVEHLAPDELSQCFAEIARCLRPHGRLFVHTFPTSTIYNVTYRLQRTLLPWRLRSWPAEPRNSYELQMHVNEQTPRRLGASLRAAGLTPETISLGNWVYNDHVPAGGRDLYPRLARHRVTKPLGVANLWALARPAA